MQSQQPSSVLIIEPDQVILQSLLDIFQADDDAALVTHTASDGASGQAAYITHQPDVLVVALDLPDQSGYKFCQAIRQIHQDSWCKIVLVSPNGADIDQVEAYESGADDLICKPYAEQELLAKVKAHIQFNYSEEQLIRRNQQLLDQLAEQDKRLEKVSEVFDRMANKLGILKDQPKTKPAPHIIARKPKDD